MQDEVSQSLTKSPYMSVNPQLAQPQNSEGAARYSNSPYFMTDTSQSYQERVNQSPYFSGSNGLPQQQQ